MYLDAFGVGCLINFSRPYKNVPFIKEKLLIRQGMCILHFLMLGMGGFINIIGCQLMSLEDQL